MERGSGKIKLEQKIGKFSFQRRGKGELIKPENKRISHLSIGSKEFEKWQKKG
jgi:hypothetical protein